MYDHLFFDADGTLFDFVAAEKWALSQVFLELGLPATDESIATYSRINNGIWLEFEQGLISMQELKTERFSRFFARHGVSGDPHRTARRYTEMLSRTYHLYPDTIEVLDALKERNIPMSLITNGIAAVQRGRLEATGTAHYFTVVAISEELGVQKPNPSYFTQTCKMVTSAGFSMNNPLVIGDSPTSDIRGGLDSGLDTCWINRFGMEPDPEIPATYEISSLYELLPLLDNLD